MDKKTPVMWNGKLYPVKVGERGSELIHLLLADALGIPGQNLGLDLIDSSGDGCKEQLPPDTDVLLMWYRAGMLKQGRHTLTSLTNYECIKTGYLQ